MGSGGSSIDRENEFDTRLKTPPVIEDKTEHLQEETQLKWPLPQKEEEKDFVPNPFIDNKRYSLLKSQYDRDFSTMRRSIKVTSIKFPYSQRTENNESNHVESNVFNTSRVQTTMKTKTNLWAGITPSVEMTNLLARLNVAHIESNEIVQQRLQNLSKEAERVLGVIIDETTEEQNRLLKYAQEIQGKLQILHREWLEKYLIELDRWQSIELEKLHDKLDHSRYNINEIFQRKLALVNKQVDEAKSQIFREEQEKQAKETNEIVSDVTKIPQQNKIQHMGTETNSDILFKIRTNAGNKQIIKENQPYYEYLDQ